MTDSPTPPDEARGPRTEALRDGLQRVLRIWKVRPTDALLSALVEAVDTVAIEDEARAAVRDPRSYEQGVTDGITSERLARAAVPLDYDALWSRFQKWEDKAARSGSGMTRDQITGASMMLGWLIQERAAVRGTEGLDVERLAKAMTTVYEQDLFPIKSETWDYDARLIAAEYERLGTS